MTYTKQTATVLTAIVLAMAGFAPLYAPSAFAWGGPCQNQTSITSNFNGTPIPGGSYIWFNAVMKLKSPVSGGTNIFVTGQTITMTVNGQPFSIRVPDAEIVFSPTATTATTVFDTSNNGFVTTVPANFGDNVFISGVAFQVPAGGLPGGINPVTWSGFVSGAGNMQWQWGAAVYTQFSTDYNSLGIKPVHSTSIDSYPNGNQAGTPENFKSFVIGGARGGGGSNWTGSYSATGTASAPCALAVDTVNSSGTAINGYQVVLYAQDQSTVLATCFSPCSFDIGPGTYYVAADSFGSETFDHWSDGTTGLHVVTISSGGTTVGLTAVYSP